jgi:hypothetical protein
MQPESPTASELTKRLIGRSTIPGDEPGSAAAALECVSTEFSRWVGARGYEALMSRALNEERSAHPALGLIRYDPRATPAVGGVAESAARHGAAATTTALTQLLESILALCIRLIGADIVSVLVERSAESRLDDSSGRRQNLTSGVPRRDQD